ncbi:hypothetical protein ABZW18_07480 [Streptomyces sp. NPDC004647]|uniref:hypothetical protein n=1 Tax=Streptomyces sp. NPDC004647 TaxID=3154671 RepID=UPI0033A12EBD
MRGAAALVPVLALALTVVTAPAVSAVPTRPADRKPLPDMLGLSVSSARETAQAAGFAMPRTYDALGKGRQQVIDHNWKVCVQDPRPGEVETSAEITLGAVRLDENCPGTSPLPASRRMPDFTGKPLSAVHDAVGSQSSVHATDVSGQDRIVLLAAGWRVCSHRPAAGEVFAGRPVEVMVVRPPERCP